MKAMTRDALFLRPAAAALGYLAVCAVLIVLRPLLPVDETRYLTVAWEMWNGGSFVVPHLNGEVYSHKPPLLFWLINLVWLATGPSEFAARMVGPLAGAGAILLAARLARRLWPDDPARPGRAAWMLATGGVFLAYGSATMFDTLLTVATLWALLVVWRMATAAPPLPIPPPQGGRETPAAAASQTAGTIDAGHLPSPSWGGDGGGARTAPGWWAILSLGAALAVGVLAKGPVILIHVMPVALTFPLWRPALGVATGAFLRATGLAVLAALMFVALWLVPALVFGDAAYRNDILWRQSAGRMVASFDHARPLWFFVALLPVFLWPWGWGRELAALFRRPFAAQHRFLVVWAVAALVAFSFVSGKQMHYLMPEIAALALLLSGPVDGGMGRWTRFLPMIPALLVVTAGIAAEFTPEALGLTGVAPLTLALAVAVVALGFLLVAVAPGRLAARLPVAPATLIAVELVAFRTLWDGNDPSRLAAEIAANAGAGVASVDVRYAGQFSYVARLAEPVQVLRDDASLAAWIAAHPGGLVLAREARGDLGLRLVVQEVLQGDDWFLYKAGSR